LAVACGGGTTAPAEDLATVAAAIPRPPPKVVLIGLDGADWNVARPLVEAGRLPVLASLVAQGASGDLRSLEPMISPALWTSVMTGVRPERHGIHDFVFKQAGVDEQPIVNATIRERLALWNILSALDVTVGIVDWYATWPAEAVNGFIVSDRIKTTGGAGEGVVFSSVGALDASLSAAPPLGPLPALERLARAGDPPPEGLGKALKEDLYRAGVARDLYAKHQPDFFAFYLKGIDAVSHFYWKHHEPDGEAFGAIAPEEIERFGAIVTDYYELCDHVLGRFLEVVDRETTVMVLSDHGFHTFARPDSLVFDLDRLLAALGLLEFEDPALAGRRSERRIRMAGTRAYAHEGTKIVSAFGQRDQPVYLNVAGRDPQGVIDPARLAEEREAIRARLAALRTDLDTPLFSRVEVREAPPGTGRQEPDLVVRVNREIAFDYEVLVDGRPYALAETFFWEYGNISGTHRLEGILVARGPAIRPGATPRDATLLDVMPTVLHLMGIPIPEDLDGRVLSELLAQGVGPRVRVASYEPLIERARSGAEAPPLDADYRERLRALGYVQ
jgi:predicted AlkP superfamily phosphohydrolase/phosphomutase